MSSIILALVLGIIEGLTAFIPVSAIGHLMIANKFINLQGTQVHFYAIIIQSGALLAAMVYFKSKLMPPIKNVRTLKKYVRMWGRVIIALIPSTVMALTVKGFIGRYFFNEVTVASALIIGAFLILYAEGMTHRTQIDHEDQITVKQAMVVGIVLCLAILFPGMSRVGAAIIGGLLCGFSRKLSVEFSFYLSIPILLVSFLFKSQQYTGYLNGEWSMIGVGALISFAVAYGVIAFFMNYIRHHNLKFFAYYRIALGSLVLFFYYV